MLKYRNERNRPKLKPKFIKMSFFDKSFYSATTFSITTFGRMTLGIMDLNATLSINNNQHNVMFNATFLLLC